jgi:hypothetical protein
MPIGSVPRGSTKRGATVHFNLLQRYCIALVGIELGLLPQASNAYAQTINEFVVRELLRERRGGPTWAEYVWNNDPPSAWIVGLIFMAAAGAASYLIYTILGEMDRPTRPAYSTGIRFAKYTVYPIVLAGFHRHDAIVGEFFISGFIVTIIFLSVTFAAGYGYSFFKGRFRTSDPSLRENFAVALRELNAGTVDEGLWRNA